MGQPIAPFLTRANLRNRHMYHFDALALARARALIGIQNDRSFAIPQLIHHEHHVHTNEMQKAFVVCGFIRFTQRHVLMWKREVRIGTAE